jgi:hypothetical protein
MDGGEVMRRWLPVSMIAKIAARKQRSVRQIFDETRAGRASSSHSLLGADQTNRSAVQFHLLGTVPLALLQAPGRLADAFYAQFAGFCA